MRAVNDVQHTGRSRWLASAAVSFVRQPVLAVVILLLFNILLYAYNRHQSQHVVVTDQQLIGLSQRYTALQSDLTLLDRYAAAIDTIFGDPQSTAQNRLHWRTLFDVANDTSSESANGSSLPPYKVATPIALDRRERVEWHSARWAGVFDPADRDFLSAVAVYATGVQWQVSLPDETAVIELLRFVLLEQPMPVSLQGCDMRRLALSSKQFDPDYPVQLQCQLRYFEFNPSVQVRE